MVELLPPEIKVTDIRSMDKPGDAPVMGDSPSTADASQSARPRSSSSEDNGQKIEKKAPVKLVRNPPTKIGIVSKASTLPSSEGASTAIDPLSHHILKRTHTENTIPQKLRNPGVPESPNTEPPGAGTADLLGSTRHGVPEPARSDTNQLKEKKKGVSFLSRFSIIGGKKKDQADSVEDDESELGDVRTEGMNAHVFSSSIGANGYIPQHKEPPRYIKVRAHNKRQREFNRMFLAQELMGSKPTANGEKELAHGIRETPPTPGLKWKSAEAIWATEFSKDGKHLAAAGQDHIVRVWSVISTPEERKAHEREEDASNGKGERLSAPVFRSKPIREFQGHTGTVLDLSWSKNNFLLSSSMDKTVRLWHISRQECLCTFKHKDFVTSIAFHPRDDRFFLAGSLDSVLRLWSIPDKSVAYWNQLPDMITAVSFSPDGKTAMAGVLSGLCMFYDTEGLKYNTQIHVRSSRGKNAKGSKITGIRTVTFPPDDPDSEVKVLITSNDSRIRLYNLRDKSLEMKFRGHENTCSQIKASFSDNACYIISGSEDRKAYIWSLGPVESENKDKRPVEHFAAHSDMVTAAVMAPTMTRQLLAASGDPIYDLCNPPPVTLLSMAEYRAESHAFHDKRNSDPISEPPPRKHEENPKYLARSMHPDGNIIITADHSGIIKVFRQDCAYQRRNDHWETGSTFSKKIGPSRLGRSASSINRDSRRNSMSHATASPQPSSDRILSWRNSIASNTSLDGVGSIQTTQTARSDRSASPGKFSRDSSTSISQAPMSSSSQPNLAVTARQQQYKGSPIITKTSPPPARKPSNAPAGMLPTPGFTVQPSEDNPLRLDSTGRSYQFWNLQNWRSQFGNSTDPSNLGSDLGLETLEHKQSVVSKLSSEENSAADGDSDGEEDALSCKNCGGKDFRAKKAIGRTGQRLVCTKCGTTAE